MPAFSFCGARCSAWGLESRSAAFRAIPGRSGRESLIFVSFFGVGELRQVCHGDS
jgi:hypothetical protein